MALTVSQQFAKAIEESTRVLVVFPKGGSVDHAATALAIADAVRRKGKTVDVTSEGFVLPQSLAFLKGAASINATLRPLNTFVISLNVSQTKADELSYSLKGDALEICVTPKSGAYSPSDVTTRPTAFVYQLIICVGVPDLVSLGSLYAAHPDFFYATPKVVIDCSPANERYGAINVVDITTASCAEVAFPLLKELDATAVNDEVATMLMTGIVAATKRFMAPTVTPRTLELASALVGCGARRDEVIQNLYRTRSLGTLKLWGRALARLKYDASLRCAWTLLIRSDFVHAGAEASELPGVIEELMNNTPDADVLAVVYEGAASTDALASQTIEALVATPAGSRLGALLAPLGAIDRGNYFAVTWKGISLQEAEKKLLAALTPTT